MTEQRDSSFKNGIIIALVGAVIGALVTIVGQPYINRIFEEAKTPKLLREYHQTKIESLPDSVKSQISLITTRYSLIHTGGGSAEQVTITITSLNKIPLRGIVIDPSSEPNSINEINDNIMKIEVPAIRPTGKLFFEITHSPKNQIKIDEIAKIGEIVSSNFNSPGPSREWWRYILIGLFLFFWIGIIGFGYWALNKGAMYLISLESISDKNVAEPSRSKIATIIVVVLTLNIISKLDLGVIDLPYIPISDIFYAVLLYLIVTNYRALKSLLSKALER